MNRQIENLYQISAKSTRHIIGLMSGTSLDGLDIALCHISNSGLKTALSLKHFITLPYDDAFRFRVRSVFAKRQIDQQQLTGLNAYIGTVHAQLINQALASWQVAATDVDIIASHGQTVYHAPQRLTQDITYPNSTLQIGDADHIASSTGIITISDFRQKHIAAGGEGAPLAAYGDYLLFRHKTENRFLLNIGGISNFTFLPSENSEEKAYATDIGPGNTLMNQYMDAHFNIEMDQDAELARQGEVNEALLAALYDHPFLQESFPKTTGPELFNLAYLLDAQQRSNTQRLPAQDIMATLNKFAAICIARAVQQQAHTLAHAVVYVSGGGLHNPLLLAHIQQLLPQIPVLSFDQLGVDPDAKEACLFAILANETLAGSPEHVAHIKDSPAVCMGKISLPY